MAEAEQEIRAIIDDRTEATRAKDAQRATRHFADDVLLFDTVNPFRRAGIEAAKERAEHWFGLFVGAVDLEVTELQISMGDRAAFSHAMHHVKGDTSWGPLDMWWRTTTCYKYADGAWKVAHEHNSVPFDPVTGQAAIDVQP